MASVNKARLVGYLGKDPEVRTTPNGVKVASFSVATSERWTDKNSGEKKERTEWHFIEVWGASGNDGLAGVAEKYLRKGSHVYLEGPLRTQKWQDKDGTDRWTTKIVLSGFGAELVLLDKQGSGGPPPANSPDDYGTSRSSGTSDSGMRDAPGADDDTIPF